MNNSSTSELDTHESVIEFAQSARDTLASLSPLGRLRQLRHQLPKFEAKVWSQLAKAGWTSILVAEELGGLGLDLQHACAIAKEVGQNPIPEPYFAAVQSVAVLNALPQGEQRDQLLMSIASGELIVGLGWQERHGQIEPEEALATVAIRTSNGYELTGQKRWVTPGTGASGWLISALEAGDVGLWWVPADTPGITVTEVERIDGSSCATLTLNNLKIPKTHRLGFAENALEALGQGSDAARLAQSAELLGIAWRAFDMTLDYLKTRVQFGKPI